MIQKKYFERTNTFMYTKKKLVGTNSGNGV